jgi:aminoacyl tRNA synthase complex-interacting multifunctional protein 1
VEEIDLGEGAPRTICSGLVGFYTPEAMTGQLVIVAANLKPRPMSGIESNGMVVCASNEAHTAVELLQPPEGAVPGERVMFAGHEGEPAVPNQMAKKKILDDVLPVRVVCCVGWFDRFC